jgi:hypothetical protein
VHVVWCPKFRRWVLGGRVAARLRELIEQKATEWGWEIVAVEVMPDRVRLFVEVTVDARGKLLKLWLAPSAVNHGHDRLGALIARVAQVAMREATQVATTRSPSCSART